MTADVIAEHLGVTRDCVYSWITKKDMPAPRVGRVWKFKVTEVDDGAHNDSEAETAKPSRRRGR